MYVYTYMYIYCMLGEHLEGLVQIVLDNHLKKGDTVSCIVGKHIRPRVVFQQSMATIRGAPQTNGPKRFIPGNVSFQDVLAALSSACVAT